MHDYHVTVYVQPHCQPCRITKRKLDDDGIPYEEADAVAKANHDYIVRQLGHQQAPVVTVHRDGQLWVHWSGLKPDVLTDVIGAIAAERAA